MDGMERVSSSIFLKGTFSEGPDLTAKEITELTRTWAERYAAEAGCVVWDVRFFKEGGDWCLKVTLDTVPPGNVTIDMCEAVNRALDKKLDELDPIEQSYFLEVSSPGVERELYRPGDYDAFAGSTVDVKLFRKHEDLGKSFTAALVRREGEQIVFRLEDERELTVPMDGIARCSIHFDYQ